mgnify:CR=1 FL=1
MSIRCGDTLLFQTPPVIAAGAAVGGKKEGEGPLAAEFDELSADNRFGQSSWEAAETYLQLRAARLCLQKAALPQEKVQLALAGDLQAQCTASSYAMRELGVPFAGLFGACSTMAEALGLGAALCSAGLADGLLAMTSSHFCAAERQFRTPLSYGAVRTPTAQWTATAAGCCLLQPQGAGVGIAAAAFGRVQDYQVKDINNMGAVYGSDEEWGEMKAGLLRAVLHNTDAVVQPRQSNTWGALSLDHVYEFMGGMNLAVRNVTGKDPDAYFADYRNRNNVKMQELKEAIGVESRATIFNPEYVKEVMKGGASSASQITEVVTNTYGWNVTKPDVIDKEMWDRIYDVYVEDSYGLGTEQFFRQQNPAALQEITAVMLETARKGMWKASEQQLNTLASLHTELVEEFGSTGSGFSGGNAKLQEFIAERVAPQHAAAYKQQIQTMKTVQSPDNKNGMVLKKDEVSSGEQGRKNALNGVWIAGGVLVLFVVLLLVLRKKRKDN